MNTGNGGGTVARWLAYRLDILKGQILGYRASFNLELGLEIEGVNDEIPLGLIDLIDVEIAVIGADRGRQVPGSLSRLF